MSNLDAKKDLTEWLDERMAKLKRFIAINDESRIFWIGRLEELAIFKEEINKGLVFKDDRHID